MEMRRVRGLAGLGAAAAGLLLAAGCADSADRRLNAGMEAMRRGDMPAAARHLQAAAPRLRANAAAHANLGVVYWRLGKLELAVDSLRVAADLSEADPRPLEYLVQLLSEQKRNAEAKQAFDEFVHRFAKPTPRALVAMGLTEHRAGNLDQAIALHQQALVQAPDYPPALYNLGCLCRDAPGLRDQAAEYLERFLTVAPADPHVPRARKYLASLSPGGGRSESGGGGLTPAPQVFKPSPADPLVAAARAATDREVYDEALLQYKEAMRRDPQAPNPLWELAQLYETKLKDPSRAQAAYADFATRFPSDPRAYRRLASPDARRELQGARNEFKAGEACYAANDLNGAIDHFSRALELDNRFAGASYNLAMAWRAKGQPLRAIEELTYTLATSPEMVEAYYMTGVIYRKLQAPQKAVEYLEAALRRKRDHAWSHLYLGYAFQDQGLHAQARPHFERFAELAPGDPAAQKLKDWLKQTAR